jgi:two-component SAPR family response regulator
LLNEIKLKLLGLYWSTELEIENVNEGIQRTLARGDEEEVERKRKDNSNMDLNRFFMSVKDQAEVLKEYEKFTKNQYIEELG